MYEANAALEAELDLAWAEVWHWRIREGMTQIKFMSYRNQWRMGGLTTGSEPREGPGAIGRWTGGQLSGPSVQARGRPRGPGTTHRERPGYAEPGDAPDRVAEYAELDIYNLSEERANHLGHADIKTTMRYAHLSPSTKATYANNVVPSTGLRLVEGQAPTTADGTQPGYKPGYSPEPAAEIG